MYSEQLEQLIKSVIADGVITEKERAVLHKKAASEGVDEDEIDVYVDGLVAQMKPMAKQEQETYTTPNESEKKYDLSFFGKVKTLHTEYYEMKRSYLRKIDSSLGANAVQLRFIDVIKHVEGKKCEGFGIFFSVSGIKKAHWEYFASLMFFSNGEKVATLSNLDDYFNWTTFEDFFVGETVGKEASNVFYMPFYMDKNSLKSLCNATNISLVVANTDSLKLKEIPLPEFESYAQLFYRLAVDNNAYPNAIVEEKNLESTDIVEVLKLLTIPKKLMNKIALGHKYFEQFAIKNSDLQLIEFDERYSFLSFNSYIKIISILKDEEPQFFLKVVYNYYEEKKNRKGEVEREKKVMNLNAGSMKIVCDGYTEVKLYPLEESKAIFEKDSEMNFYPISEQDMRTIIEAENVSINLYGKKLKAENIRHAGLSKSLPFVWKQAFATLMGEDVPEKKTLFGRIKGLFK